MKIVFSFLRKNFSIPRAKVIKIFQTPKKMGRFFVARFGAVDCFLELIIINDLCDFLHSNLYYGNNAEYFC